MSEAVGKTTSRRLTQRVPAAVLTVLLVGVPPLLAGESRSGPIVPPLPIVGQDVRVEIRDATARVTIIHAILNPHGFETEALVLLPLPEGARYSALRHGETGAEAVALPLESARQKHVAARTSGRPAALLEPAGASVARLHVWPLHGANETRIETVWERPLRTENERFVFELGETVLHGAQPLRTLSVTLSSDFADRELDSPTHSVAPTDDSTAERTEYSVPGFAEQGGGLVLLIERREDDPVPDAHDPTLPGQETALLAVAPGHR